MVNFVSKKEDWWLLNDVWHLKEKCLNPTDGEELCQNAPHLKACIFCWCRVEQTDYSDWYISENIDCCICQNCYDDFKSIFHWRILDGWDIEWFGKT